ncbi:MAG: putative sulfate exporter family transporter, partial [Sulfitobacter sp.]|nr:putative sulfate exporter family transporter [Sulfitobacter sp.]
MTDTTLSDLVHADKTTPSIWPGLALAAIIAALAFALRYLPGVGMLSPLILAILLGMALRNTLGTPEVAKTGLAISMRPVLRAGIILMGLQLTLGQVAAVGWVGVAVIALSLVLTFGFTAGRGRVLGVDVKLTQSIAAGTSSCGASAVIATNTVARGRDEDVAYAVACVTIFGSLSMILLPLAE